MLQGLYIALGAAALVLLLAATMLDVDPDTRAVFRLLSMILWWVWAIQSTEVTQVGPNGTVTESYPSLLIIGLVMGALMALAFSMQALDLFEERRSGI